MEVYSGIVRGHERAHEAFFIARVRDAQLGPFLEDQRSAGGLDALNGRIPRLRDVLLGLARPVGDEEARIGTVVPGCTIDFRAPYARGGPRRGGPQ